MILKSFTFGLLMLFCLCLVGSSSSSKLAAGVCGCPAFLDCDIILRADAVIIGKVIFQRSNSLTVVVLTSFSGTLRVGQTLIVSFNPNCFRARLNGSYLLSLSLNNRVYSVDDCGFHLLSSQISPKLLQMLRNIDTLCPKQCVDDSGMVHQNGDSWKPHPCEFCSCDNGQIYCAMMSCALPDCENPIFVEGECCPVCPQQDCSLVRCAAPTCPVPLVKEGECCGTCSEDCRLVLCPDLACPNYRYEPGECCPTCFDCSEIMCPMIYCEGQYHSPASCCPVCPVDCSAVLCLALEDCENSYVPEGECCPVCLDDNSA